MITHSTRDWRGIKHQLGHYSTADLLNLMHNAELTNKQIDDFAARVAAELSRREMVDEPA